MKKKIQKYLAGEREGFSLVELIIVIAIMAILIGVVTLAVLPNIAKSKESKDITALDSILSATNNAVASQQVAQDGEFAIKIVSGTATLTSGGAAATSDVTYGTHNAAADQKVLEEVSKLMGKEKIDFNSSKVTNPATGATYLKCSWEVSGTTIGITAAITDGTNTVTGDYMGKFEAKN